MSTVEALLIVVVCLLCGLILLVWKTRIAGGRDVEAAVSKTWIALGLGERIQAVEMHAREIRDSYRSFEQLLRVPIERGSFAELSLETILGDGLPPDMYMIRQRVLDGKVPDASIRSTVGVICIDSKFPLDNYHRMLTADEREMAGFARSFARDVRGHLAKIARDYVQPDKGSAAFAFAYIPSEAVYYYLVNQAYELLREYTRQGVQVVSPLTLGHKLELIKAGAHALRLSENAEVIQRELQALGRRFAQVDESWRVFYETHLRNLAAKGEEVDAAYRALREEFGRVSYWD